MENLVNAEIETLQDQLLSVRQDVPGIVHGLAAAQFNQRPAKNRWSIAECLDHLNATARLLMPGFDAAIEKGQSLGLTSNGPFAYPLFERLFLAAMEPPPRFRFRAPAPLAPAPSHRDPGEALREFLTWQERLGERILRADGLDLRRVRMRSPVQPLLAYSLGTGFAATLAHERRHLWQARQVRNELERRRG
jgi:hypothetical protein